MKITPKTLNTFNAAITIFLAEIANGMVGGDDCSVYMEDINGEMLFDIGDSRKLTEGQTVWIRLRKGDSDSPEVLAFVEDAQSKSRPKHYDEN